VREGAGRFPRPFRREGPLRKPRVRSGGGEGPPHGRKRGHVPHVPRDDALVLRGGPTGRVQRGGCPRRVATNDGIPDDSPGRDGVVGGGGFRSHPVLLQRVQSSETQPPLSTANCVRAGYPPTSNADS